MRISSILADEKVRLSCEVFPPKRFDGIAQACQVTREIAAQGQDVLDARRLHVGKHLAHVLLGGLYAGQVAERGHARLLHSLGHRQRVPRRGACRPIGD